MTAVVWAIAIEAYVLFGAGFAAESWDESRKRVFLHLLLIPFWPPVLLLMLGMKTFERLNR